MSLKVSVELGVTARCDAPVSVTITMTHADVCTGITPLGPASLEIDRVDAQR